MSGFNLERKMKRTKREELKLIENMNRSALQQLMKQQVEFVEKFNDFSKEIAAKFNGFIAETVLFQKEVLAIRNALEERGIINSLDVARHLGFIDERERLEKSAIILGQASSKSETEVKKEKVEKDVDNAENKITD